MTPSDRDRLVKLLRLLASDQDGERGTAAAMANKLAERLGGWDKLIAPASTASPDPIFNPGVNEWDLAQAWAARRWAAAQRNKHQSRGPFYYGFDWSNQQEQKQSAEELRREIERMIKERDANLAKGKA